MNKPIKICKNPECKKEYSDYKSAKSEHCCTTCTQRAGFLRRKEQNKELASLNKEYKKQQELITFLWNNAKRPYTTDLLDLFNINYGLFTKSEDEHGYPVYKIKDMGIWRNPNNANEVFIKRIIKRKAI